MDPNDRLLEEDDPGLVKSLRNLTSDIIEYGEARFRLIQAEMKLSMGRYGGAATLGAIAATFALIGYLPLVMLATLYLSSTWFDGKFIGPLAIVAVTHFLVATLFAILAGRRWKRTQALEKELIDKPELKDL